MDIKFTIIRTDAKGEKHVSYRTADSFLERIATDDSANSVTRYRQELDFQYADELPKLQEVYPSAVFTIDEGANLMLKSFNGLLHLHVANLGDKAEMQKVKKQVAMLPMTLLAVDGADDRSVEILVCVEPDAGALPANNEDAERFMNAAKPIVEKVYRAFLPQSSEADNRPTASPLYSCFLMTQDSEPYYNPDAVALKISAFSDVDTLKGCEDNSQDSSSSASEESSLISFLTSNYSFRFNTVMGYTEYRPRTRFPGSWQPVDNRVINTFVLKAQMAGFEVWDRDVKRYVQSSMVKAYNPVHDYLWKQRGKWDGKDHIGAMAERVPTDNPDWKVLFHTWFLAMVAQWMHVNRRYGNSLAPLLVSKQGFRKSTFCKMLIPTELQWGYIDDLQLSEKKQTLQLMSQMLLINMDEFNSVSQKLQEGFVKNIIQLATVKVKRPYGKHIEEFPRLASFIATSNMTDILTDPSGSRRFIGIEVNAPIDTDTPVNYSQLYAQAVDEIENGAKYWLDDEQTRLLMESNLQFQHKPDEQLLFESCYEPADSEEDGSYVLATDIYNEIRKQAGSLINPRGISVFGRILNNIPDLKRRRKARGVEYLVKKREK